MQASIVLTVAQGKRLIGKAVAQMSEVRNALNTGIVAIGRGTTNGYVAEEILGQALPKGEYVAGRTLPPGMPGERLGTGQYPDIVLKMGECTTGITIAQAVEAMNPGDVLIKGGNALNYSTKEVGVLIGHPCGGTCGDNYGTVISRKVHLVIPIGLEKLVVEDIGALSRASRCPEMHPSVPVVSLFPITGIIVTEIEAFALLCDVQARLLSAGGVGGAEGAIWLLLEGTQRNLDRALDLWQSVTTEPNLPLKPL